MTKKEQQELNTQLNDDIKRLRHYWDELSKIEYAERIVSDIQFREESTGYNGYDYDRDIIIKACKALESITELQSQLIVSAHWLNEKVRRTRHELENKED